MEPMLKSSGIWSAKFDPAWAAEQRQGIYDIEIQRVRSSLGDGSIGLFLTSFFALTVGGERACHVVS